MALGPCDHMSQLVSLSEVCVIACESVPLLVNEGLPLVACLDVSPLPALSWGLEAEDGSGILRWWWRFPTGP